MLSSDKENISPLTNALVNGKQSNNVVKKSSKSSGLFVNLLHDATNQVREAEDKNIAIDLQTDEACDAMYEWAREDSDAKLAKKLAMSFDEELKSEKYMNEAKGEAEALRIAIEERKRLKEEAEEKEILRQRDEELAKKIVLEEEEQILQSRKILESDEKYINGLRRSYDTKPETKSTPDKVHEEEYKTNECKDDFARGFFQSPESSKEEAAELSMKNKNFVKEARDKFKESKKNKVIDNSGNSSNISSEQLAKLWNDCDAEIDDVVGGICISLYLPKIIKIKVFEVNGKKVCIEANRKNDKMDLYAHSDNTEYIAEFNIKGKEVKLIETDISHEYLSDVGLLFIFIEKVSLADESDNTSRSLSRSNSIVSSFKSGLKRIFGSKK